MPLLTGPWRFANAVEERRREFASPDYDDDGWSLDTDPLPRASAPALIRTRFSCPPPDADERLWLVCAGVCYQGDIWLDGAYVGDTEGYFAPHAFDVTAAAAAMEDHLLAIEVACPPNTALLGTLRGDSLPGIWRPLSIERSGPVRLQRCRVLCVEANAERAVLEFRASFDSSRAGKLSVTTTVGGRAGAILASGHENRSASAGENRLRWRVAVDRPPLWWPRSLGEATRCAVTVAVHLDGEESDERTLETGLREVTVRSGVMAVNGERLYLKGRSATPSRATLCSADAAVSASRDGYDLMRVHGHIGGPALYDEADRLGLLIWQDLPLSGPVARRTRGQAARQAREAVELLGHHPSIVLWCGHDRSADMVAVHRGEVGGVARWGRVMFTPQMPSIARNVVDATVRRAFERADPTRPVLGTAGPGSRLGDALCAARLEVDSGRDLERVLAAVPRLARFLPLLPGAPDAVEALRRIKYRPAGGFCIDAGGSCPPVIVTGRIATSDPLTVDVHAVSDRREPLEAARADATLAWRIGGRLEPAGEWRWEGTVPADACVRIGVVRAVVPDEAEGFCLRLHLIWAAGSANGETAASIMRDGRVVTGFDL